MVLVVDTRACHAIVYAAIRAMTEILGADASTDKGELTGFKVMQNTLTQPMRSTREAATRTLQPPKNGKPFSLKNTLRVFAVVTGLFVFPTVPLAAQSGACCGGNVVARIGTEVITEQQLNEVLAEELRRTEERLYRLKYNTLQHLIEKHLLEIQARDQKISSKELREQISRKAREGVLGSEIDAYYESHFPQFARMEKAKALETKSLRNY